MITIPKRSFSSLKPKGDEKAPKSIDKIEEMPYSEKVDYKNISESYFREPKITVESSEYIPGSVELMTVFKLINGKSFPRKGPGKSTKIKILDAIIMAAINKKLIIQGA